MELFQIKQRLNDWFPDIENYIIDQDDDVFDEYDFCNDLMIHLLNYANSCNELLPILEWLDSEEGEIFFDESTRQSQIMYEQYAGIREEIDGEIISLTNSDDQFSNQQILNGASDWLNENPESIPNSLRLF